MRTLVIIKDFDTPNTDHGLDAGDIFANPDTDAYHIYIQPLQADLTINELKEIVPTFEVTGDESTAAFTRTFDNIDAGLFDSASLTWAQQASN
jgi:hypothetical protein